MTENTTPATKPAYIEPTTAEKSTWIGFGVALALALIFAIWWGAQLDAWDGDPATPFAFMMIASSVAGVLLLPGILLTGIRHLAQSLRSVGGGEQVPDAENSSAEG